MDAEYSILFNLDPNPQTIFSSYIQEKNLESIYSRCVKSASFKSTRDTTC